MTTHPSKVATLNPFAPEYYPIPPGVAPNPDAPPPPFLRPRPIASAPQPFPPPPPRYYFPRTPLLVPARAHAIFNAAPYYAGNPDARIQRPPPPTTQGGSFGRPRRRPRGDRRNGRDAPNRCMQKKDVGRRNDRQVMPLSRDDEKTTVMIKNIPYDCPRGDLIRLVDEFCSLENGKHEDGVVSAYDFLYLPIDFITKKSRGYAFVNFTNTAAVWKFFQAFQSKRWASICHAPNWTKLIDIVAAKFQGKEALSAHFSKSNFECETDEYLPVSFLPARDGSGQPGQVTTVGIRRGRGRNHY